MFRKLITILIISFLLVLPVQAVSPIPVSNQTTLTANTDVSSNSWTVVHDSGTSGQNRGLIVWLAESGRTDQVDGVTYNGQALTLIKAFTALEIVHATAWFLADPPTGSNNLVVSYTQVLTVKTLMAVTLQDIVQSSPIDTTTQNDVPSNTSIDKELTTIIDNDILIISVSNRAVASNVTPDVGQIDLGEAVQSYRTNWSYIEKATAGAITTGYTWTTSGDADFYVISLKFIAPTPPIEEEIRKVQDIVWFD